MNDRIELAIFVGKCIGIGIGALIVGSILEVLRELIVDKDFRDRVLH